MSSKKYKRKGKLTQQSNEFLDKVGTDPIQQGTTSTSCPPIHSCNDVTVSNDENSQPIKLKPILQANSTVSSPLSLVSTELKLTDSSRNRKPIYVSQTNCSETAPNQD
jgi:hypothetical protein